MCFNHYSVNWLFFETCETFIITFYRIKVGHSLHNTHSYSILDFISTWSSVKFRDTHVFMIPPNRKRITEFHQPNLISRSLPKNNGFYIVFTALLFGEYFSSSNSHRWRYETEPGKGTCMFIIPVIGCKHCCIDSGPWLRCLLSKAAFSM